MAGRVKAQANAVENSGLAVFHRLDVRIDSNTQPEHLLAFASAKVLPHSWSGVVRVGMSDHGSVNRSPRIDVEITIGTIQTPLRNLKEFTQEQVLHDCRSILESHLPMNL